ncbi:EAL domain-containing protein [Sulfurimonas paralvinellae]|uniref:EAL domain-containing protein n=1 Tax=Sulfurimonas paralvinellae TaxID=317658 RepID=A0A7M1B9Z4_9BACT|nr:EAL domain-containing protein [Sulfurimonas paralvinellae]QOP46540.1 EAL domain-containing protein [Sulfurimonas paralvinellae]
MMQKLKHADRTTLILFLFIFFIAILFYTSYKIKAQMNFFAVENQKITELQMLDIKLNNIALATNKFTNYDIIDKAESDFTKLVGNIHSALKRYSPDAIPLLDKVLQKFQQKREDLEYFKAQNASLINSSHFLFDLHTTITQDNMLALEAKNITNEILFYILRYASSDYIDKKIIETKLAKLQKTADKYSNRHLHTFYKQAVVMLNTLQSLKEVSVDIENNPLPKDIQRLKEHLRLDYEQNLEYQTLLALLFFIFSIILLITLILSHLDSNRRKKELLAFRSAIEKSDNSVVITDSQRNIIYVNESFEKTTGYTAKEALGHNPNFLKSGMQDENFYKDLNSTLAQGKKWEGEFINKRKDGRLLYEKTSIIPIYLEGKILNFIALKLDITDYIERNKKLVQAAAVFENTEEAIIIADADGKVISVNNAFTNIYGYTLDEVKGTNLSMLHAGVYDDKFYADVWYEINKNGMWRGKLINKTKEGQNIPVWTTIKKIKDEHGKTVNYTAIQTDLREIERSQAKADYLAYHDPLTGLYNRVNFEEYLAHALLVAKRNESLMAILFIDLDRFKIINDTLGHDIGDKVLITVAERLKNTLRDSDFISRWGGDEFVVILENIVSASDTAIVATNLVEVLKEPMNIDGHHLITTASIGIALFPENGEDTNTLIKHADSAMYQAKDLGKNNFCYYTSELSSQIQKKLAIDMALHNALEKNEIYMLFQPQYDLQTQQIISTEALVRWENAELGFVPPDKFIPIAEDSGTIVSLGYFIFEESCKAYKKMKEAGVDLQHIAINVSSIQFKEPHLLDTFVSIVKRHNLHPSEIEIEITERFLMDNTIANINLLQSFRNYGFQISIDDFGTGYSSMSYLKQLPIDTIKIDKSFVDDIADGSSDNVIIEAMIALSKTLGYQIVAEGIETKEQEDFLGQTHCDIGQGYLFSKPISSNEIIARFSS